MRGFLVIPALVLLACSAAQAQKRPCTTVGDNNAFLGIQTIRLWSGDAPQAKGNACEDTPTLTIFEPQNGHQNGSAVVVLPGGAYAGLAANLEGRQVADWFAARGFRAFVLSYRLSSNGYLTRGAPCNWCGPGPGTTRSIPIGLSSSASRQAGI